MISSTNGNRNRQKRTDVIIFYVRLFFFLQTERERFYKVEQMVKTIREGFKTKGIPVPSRMTVHLLKGQHSFSI